MPDTLYRRKPLTLEAIQFDGMNSQAVLAFVAADPHPSSDVVKGGVLDDKSLSICCGVDDAAVVLQKGDWLLRIDGQYSACQPDVFTQTYEPIEAVPVHPAADCAPKV